MTYFFLFLVSAMGLTHVIVDSKIAEEPVKWLKKKLPDKILWFNPKEALDCHQCTGFWVGLFCSAAWGIPWFPLWSVDVTSSVATILLIAAWIALILVRWVLCGFASSVACLWVSHYFEYLQAQAMVDLGPLPEEQNEH
jgi:hypothetical protein